MLLDTNVVSEIIKLRPDPMVDKFIRAQDSKGLFVPSVVVAELRYGVEQLPAGQRRRVLEQAFEGFLQTGFADRVLVFDAACARGYALVRTTREAGGCPVSFQDALIGGMAHGAVMVTRNVSDFEGYGLTVLNPWVGAS